MANANATLSRGKSKPEIFAQWLFDHTSQFRNLLAFLLIAALTIISIKFNIELGRLSAVDETSKQLLPTGYALLDLSALFLSGYVGIKSQSRTRKFIAWCWFIFLLCLSLWAAASFTLSIDARANNSDLEHRIEQQRLEVDNLNIQAATWQANVSEAIRFKSKHQNTLEAVQVQQRKAANTLHTLETALPNPTMAIYGLVAPVIGLTPTLLNTLVRLLWAGALTLSPIIIMLLVSAELASSKVKTERKLTPETKPRVTKSRSTQPTNTALEVPAVRGHNGATPVQELNGLKYCIEWLKSQPVGRVTRAKIGLVSKIKNREGVTKIITALIDQGRLVRLNNGQLSKPSSQLRVVK